MAGGDGFLARWSRRKAGVKESPDAVASPPSPPSPPSSPSSPSPPEPASLPAPGAPGAIAAEAPPPLPTLADVARLTRDSDFSPYVARDVDAGVRNAAMKKLFSDPHFNVMDGLDTYIDDYGKPDPIPLSMLRRMNQSAVLGLFADDPEPPAPAPDALAAPAPKACPDGSGPAGVAQSPPAALPPPAPDPRADDDPDLQLQPDDAARPDGAGPGPRP